eukprot:766289-Hanusia_phi.AAC.2
MRLSKLLVPMSLIFAVLIILTYMNLPNIDIGASHLKNHHHMAGFSIEHGSNTTATEQSANEEIRGNGGRAEKKSRPALNFSESELRKMVSKPPTWTEHNPCLEVRGIRWGCKGLRIESRSGPGVLLCFPRRDVILGSMGPSSGGKQVFILPQSQEGRSDESVYCQFGIARSARFGFGKSSPKCATELEQVHKVIEGDTYANIADRYNLNLDALLNMNGVRRDAAASLRNGAIIQIQQEVFACGLRFLCRAFEARRADSEIVSIYRGFSWNLWIRKERDCTAKIPCNTTFTISESENFNPGARLPRFFSMIYDGKL